MPFIRNITLNDAAEAVRHSKRAKRAARGSPFHDESEKAHHLTMLAKANPSQQTHEEAAEAHRFASLLHEPWDSIEAMSLGQYPDTDDFWDSYDYNDVAATAHHAAAKAHYELASEFGGPSLQGYYQSAPDTETVDIEDELGPGTGYLTGNAEDDQLLLRDINYLGREAIEERAVDGGLLAPSIPMRTTLTLNSSRLDAAFYGEGWPRDFLSGEEGDGPIDLGNQADDAENDVLRLESLGDKEKAGRSHVKAAQLHHRLAEKAKKAGKHRLAQHHREAAERHQRAVAANPYGGIIAGELEREPIGADELHDSTSYSTPLFDSSGDAAGYQAHSLLHDLPLRPIRNGAQVGAPPAICYNTGLYVPPSVVAARRGVHEGVQLSDQDKMGIATNDAYLPLPKPDWSR